ncbi:MAG TPA: zinc-ribbon domain-containing protein [Gemmatimonadaceae bacterium]
MNVSCPQCSTVYRVDPAKVPEGGVRARCSACGGVIPVGVSAAPRRPTPVDAIGDAFAQPRPGPFTPAQNRQTPVRPMRPVTPPMSPRVTPQATPRARTPQSSSPGLGAALPPLRPTPRSAPPVRATPPTPSPAVAAAPPPPSPQPVSVPAETPPPAAPAPSAVPPAAGARRPINPFLARDPSLRAKRLARALVSDMVAYYPAKHAEGLEKGTLKELFRDEIKKSYEEYVAQVGADFARSTTHFQESLNEVLGAGRKIF